MLACIKNKYARLSDGVAIVLRLEELKQVIQVT